MGSESIRVTVGVPTYNRPRHIVRCVEAILKNTYDSFELLVIDQSSSDATKQLINAGFPSHPKLRYIHTQRVGPSYARNVALQQASGSLILYTDDDVIVSKNWIQGHVRCRNILENQGITAGVVGGPIHAVYESPLPEWWPEELLYSLCDVDFGTARGPYPDGRLPMGANFGCPVDLLKSVGGFDERIGPAGAWRLIPRVGEDSATATKIARIGYPPYFEPDAPVRHLTSADRLTRRYFCLRIFSQGYSTQLWEFGLDPPAPTSLVRTACKELIKSIRSALRILLGSAMAGTKRSPKSTALEAAWCLQFLGRLCATLTWSSMGALRSLGLRQR